MYTKQILFTLIMLIVLLFTSAAWAQRGNQSIRIDVPFEFEVGNRVLPAGVYIIDRESPYMLTVHDAKWRIVATATAISAEAPAAPSQPKVQFYVNDGRSELARVWSANSRYGYELPVHKSKNTVEATRSINGTGSSGR